MDEQLQVPDITHDPVVMAGEEAKTRAAQGMSDVQAQEGELFKRQTAELEQRQQDWRQASGNTPQNMIGYTMKQAPLLMALTALAGGHGKTSGLTALSSLNGMVQGISKGSQDEYKDAEAKYQQALSNLQEQWKLRDQTYETLAKSFQNTYEGQQRAWEIANAAVGVAKADAEKTFTMRHQVAQLENQVTNQATERAQRQQQIGIEQQRLDLAKKAAAEAGDATVDPGTVGMLLTGAPLNQVIPGFGKAAAQERKAARNAAVKAIQDADPTISAVQAGQELARRQVEYIGGKASVQQLDKMLGASEAAVAQLAFNVKKSTEFMDKVSAQTDLSPVLNAIINKEETWTGNPNMAPLFFYMTGVAQEAARIQSGGQASIAQLHQGASEQAQQWLNAGAITPASWKTLSPEILAEGKNRIETFKDAAKAMVPGGPGATSNVPKVGDVVDGYKFKGGDPADKANWEKAGG